MILHIGGGPKKTIPLLKILEIGVEELCFGGGTRICETYKWGGMEEIEELT